MVELATKSTRWGLKLKEYDCELIYRRGRNLLLNVVQFVAYNLFIACLNIKF